MLDNAPIVSATSHIERHHRNARGGRRVSGSAEFRSTAKLKELGHRSPMSNESRSTSGRFAWMNFLRAEADRKLRYAKSQHPLVGYGFQCINLIFHLERP